MAKLVPCPACDRHVRSGDPACPFCGAKTVAAPSGATGPAARALTRAAILFVGATAVGGCSTEVVAMYGPAPVDASSDVKDGSAAPDVVAMYGPAPIDASADSNAPDVVAMYGPAPVDAGDG